MPDTKCPICQPDLPAEDIKICESCKTELSKKALINALVSSGKIGIIGLNNSNAEIGIELARVMEGKHEVIIVNADIPIATPTLPAIELMLPKPRYYEFEAPITRKERRKQKRKSK